MPRTVGLDPSAILAIRDLDLRVKVVAKGLWSGLHRSPYHGFSVEFSEYRQYCEGDDLRYLDWKVLARSNRHYIKQFEDETNVRCLVLLDSSRSMMFCTNGILKFEYAKTVAATFAYFMLQQRDMAGLACFDHMLHPYVEPRWRSGQFNQILSSFPSEATGKGTDLASCLEEANRLCKSKTLIYIVSDFLEDSSQWIGAVRELQSAGHELRLTQVLDPAELDLDFGETGQWQDLETGQTIHLDPSEAASAYRKRFAQRQEKLQHALQSCGVPMLSVTTDRPLDWTLIETIKTKAAKALSKEFESK